jgi:hypothetical protein
MESLNNTMNEVFGLRYKPLTNKEWNKVQNEIQKETNQYFNSLDKIEIIQISFVNYNKTQIFYTTQKVVNELNILGYKGLFNTKKVNAKIDICDIQKIEYAVSKIKKYNAKKHIDSINNLYDVSIVSDKIRLIK